MYDLLCFYLLQMERHIILGLTKTTYKLHNETLKNIQKWNGC